MGNQTISEKISDFALGLKVDDIPEHVRSYAKLLMTDTFGVALAARKEEHVDSVLRALEKLPGRPEATLMGTGQKMTVDHAAIYNGCLIHGQDFDDTHAAAIIHPSAVVVNAALAIGEKENRGGADILAGIIAGYEVMIRLGEACKGRLHKNAFHPTGVFAPFAAICVAGRIRHIDRDILVNAMGIAGSFAGSLMQFSEDGTWEKKLHPGWGIHAGLTALRFAEEGFKGSAQVFEGKQGLFSSHAGTTEYLEGAFGDLGSRWAAGEIAFKFYPICHMMHSHIDILLSLMKEYRFKAEDIDAMEAVLYPRSEQILADPKEAKRRPKSAFNMRFSIYYNLAQAAIHEGLPGKIYDMEWLEHKAVLDMIDRITCVTDPQAEVEGHFPGKLKVTLKDHRIFEREQLYEVGAKENPVTKDHVLNKFYTNVKEVISKEGADRLLEQIDHFEQIEDIEAMMRLLKN